MPFQQRAPRSSLRLFAERGQSKSPSGANLPTMRGNMELTLDDLKWAVEQHKAGQPIKFRLAVWKRQPKGGGAAFLSGDVQPDIPFQRSGGGGNIPGLDAEEAPQQDDITL